MCRRVMAGECQVDMVFRSRLRRLGEVQQAAVVREQMQLLKGSANHDQRIMGRHARLAWG